MDNSELNSMLAIARANDLEGQIEDLEERIDELEERIEKLEKLIK